MKIATTFSKKLSKNNCLFAGYYGERCEKHQCSPNQCMNGKCVIQAPYTSDPLCRCWNGFAGRFCDVCSPGFCLNGGTCVAGLFRERFCSCPSGWSGERYVIVINVITQLQMDVATVLRSCSFLQKTTPKKFQNVENNFVSKRRMY